MLAMSLEAALEELFETCPASRVLAKKMYDHIEELRAEVLTADGLACEAERVAARYRDSVLAQEKFDGVLAATLQKAVASGGSLGGH